MIISSDMATGFLGGWRAGPSDVDDGLAVGMALGLPAIEEVRRVMVALGNNNAQPEGRRGATDSGRHSCGGRTARRFSRDRVGGRADGGRGGEHVSGRACPRAES